MCFVSVVVVVVVVVIVICNAFITVSAPVAELPLLLVASKFLLHVFDVVLLLLLLLLPLLLETKDWRLKETFLKYQTFSRHYAVSLLFFILFPLVLYRATSLEFHDFICCFPSYLSQNDQ